MDLCPKCKGRGCEDCDFEGTLSQVTTSTKIIHKKKLSHDDYEKKRNKDMKFDKKNAIRE